MRIRKYIVYVKADDRKRITDVNSSAFTSDSWGTKIDEGEGDKYHHAQNHYFPHTIYTDDGIPRYKLVEGKPVERTEEEIQNDRLLELISAKYTEMSNACNRAITDGIDVETTQGIEHFSLTKDDQINLTTAYGAVQSGAPSYLYHADIELCRPFSAEEINAISEASIQHKLYHTTLCNHVLNWVRRCKTVDELSSVSYSYDALPKDLKDHMDSILNPEQV